MHATLHAVAAEDADRPALVRALKARLAETHGVGHATIEVEAPADCTDAPVCADAKA